MNIKRKNLFEKILNLFFLLVSAAGVATSIFMNFVNRSLWLDEAHLAYSFSIRSLLNLWDGALEKNQSAPLGWLYIEKLFAVIFGNTEFVVRIGSILGFAVTLFFIWYLLDKCFHVKYPLGTCAFYANIPFVLKYSNVFKPYICDGLFVLMVIWLFYLYKENRISLYGMAAGWALLVWFANPACFFEGGILVSEGIFVLIERNWKKLKELVIAGVSIVASFIVYYFFWLREVALSDHMQNFWEGKNFPLIPASMSDFAKMKAMITEIYAHTGSFYRLLLFLMAVALIAAVIRKNRILMGLYIGIFITCFASYINMFPVQDRLWCFFYSLIVLLGFVGLDELVNFVIFMIAKIKGLQMTDWRKLTDSIKIYMVGISVLVMVFSNNGIKTYLKRENVYWKREEINEEISYLEKNIKSDEMIYVYVGAVDGFLYKNDYDSISFGGYENNVILGSVNFSDTSDCEGEIEKIISHDKIYIVCSHYTDERLSQLLKAVHENGYFQLVSYEYATPLWFYCNNLSDSKIHISYEIVEHSENGNIENVMLRIYNDGEAYLNHNWENVSLVNIENGDRREMEKNIAPGQTVDIMVSYEKESPPVFRLENEYGVICGDSEIKIDYLVN